MKKAIFLLATLFPLIVNAAKIDKDEIDEFTGERTLTTSWESINKGYIHVRFRLQNNEQFLDFKYISNGAIVIAKDDKLLFKATDDAITSFKSIATFTGGRGDGATGISGSAVWGIRASYLGDVSWFQDHCVRLMRIFEQNVYTDIKISEIDGNKLRSLASLFAHAVNKDTGDQKTLTVTCTVDFLKKGKKSRSWSVVESVYYEDIYCEDLDRKISEWRAKSDDKAEYDVKIKRDYR